MSVKAKQEELVKLMKQWQKLENNAVAQTAKIMTEVDHPLIRLVMEIIQRDSNMHHRVQQLIIDATEGGFIEINPDDLVGAWDSIENHIKIEKKTIELAQASLRALEGTSKTVLQQYLVDYLLTDEQKHDKMLSDLDTIKRGMFKSS